MIRFLRSLLIFTVLITATSCCDPQQQYLFKPPTSSNNTLEICCTLCSAGQFMVKECTAENATVCKDCPPGYFQDNKNKNKECKKCTPVCDGKRREVWPCSSTKDLTCECPPGKFYNEDVSYCEDCSHCPDGFVVATNCTHKNNTVCKKAGEVVKQTSSTPSSTSASTESSRAVTSSTSIFETELPSLATEAAHPSPPATVTVYVDEPPIFKALTVIFGLILVILIIAAVIAYKYTFRSRCRNFTHGTLASAEGSDVSLLWVGDFKLKLREVPASVIHDLAELLNPPSARNWLHLAGRLGFTQQQVANYKLQPTEATQSLLQDWGAHQGSTAARLHQELLAMGRSDAAQVLHSVVYSPSSGSGTLV